MFRGQWLQLTGPNIAKISAAVAVVSHYKALHRMKMKIMPAAANRAKPGCKSMG